MCSKNINFMRFILKRKRLITIAIILCICFLLYQLLSLKELNFQMMTKTNDDLNFKSKPEKSSVDVIDDNKIESNHKTVEQIENQILVNVDESDAKHKSIDDKMDDKQDVKPVIGVMLNFYSLYQKKSDSFRCLLTGEVIPYSYINDDYCDCVDGSDEPSTNACPTNRFYCTKSQQTIPSSKVNDGICDCCDGSDETKQMKTPIILSSSQLKIMESSRRLVDTVPCHQRC